MTADLYAPCRNCEAAWSAARPKGTDGTMSERTRSHEAGCPGDVAVSPPAGLDAAVAVHRRPGFLAGVTPAQWDAVRDLRFREIEDARAVAGVLPGEPLLGIGEPPYGRKTNGVRP